MKIIIAGGTGFIGSSLIPTLLANGHEVTVLSRNPEKVKRRCPSSVSALSWQSLEERIPDNFDSVINVTGENIAGARWTEKRKNLLKISRINTTEKLVAWLLKSKNRKQHLYNASAVGIYGTSSSDQLTESSTLPVDKNIFSSELVKAWEEAALPAVKMNIPVTFLRFGVVLKRHEGMLKKLAPSFFVGLGSVIGNGQQPLSWVHVQDLISAVLFLLKTPKIKGPVNICAPVSTSQKEFAASLAKAMHRPLFLTLPAFMVKILFGQMGEELLLSGQRAFPEVLNKHGFKFSYPTIDSALQHEWR